MYKSIKNRAKTKWLIIKIKTSKINHTFTINIYAQCDTELIFLKKAKDSCVEVMSLILVSRQLGYLDEESTKPFLNELELLMKMICPQYII